MAKYSPVSRECSVIFREIPQRLTRAASDRESSIIEISSSIRVKPDVRRGRAVRLASVPRERVDLLPGVRQADEVPALSGVRRGIRNVGVMHGEVSVRSRIRADEVGIE